MDGYSLKKFFTSPFPVRTLPYLLLAFGALGFLDATYLTIQHYINRVPPCTIGGCETVLTSTYATLGQIPIALIGAIFYGVVLLLTGIYLTIISSKTRNLSNRHSELDSESSEPRSRIKSGMTIDKILSTILFILCIAGLLVGLTLIGIQAFILHAWCYYCLFSELIDFLLFDAAWWLYNSQKV